MCALLFLLYLYSTYCSLTLRNQKLTFWLPRFLSRQGHATRVPDKLYSASDVSFIYHRRFHSKNSLPYRKVRFSTKSLYLSLWSLYLHFHYPRPRSSFTEVYAMRNMYCVTYVVLNLRNNMI